MIKLSLTRSLWIAVGFLVYLQVSAQQTFPSNTTPHQPNGHYILKGATIHLPTGAVENASLMIKNGKIESVGKNITAPKGAISIDASGKHIYPSFIDVFSSYGLDPVKGDGKFNYGNYQATTKSPNAQAWNDALRPQFRAHEHIEKSAEAEKLRKEGFGAVLSHRYDGISRGSGVATTLGEQAIHREIIKPVIGHFFSFERGTSKVSYPTSLMGCIALLRQTHFDAQWYKNYGYKEEKNLSLEAWNELTNQPYFFKAKSRLDVLRIGEMSKEFKQKAIIKEVGDSYMRIDEIKKAGVSLIVSLDFPKPYDVENPYSASMVTLGDMKHWELAPQNPAAIQRAGVPMAITREGLKDGQFLKHLRVAVKNGLSEKDALKAITMTPATIMKVQNQIGSLEKGKIANFLVVDDNLFTNGKIEQNWVRGVPHTFETGTKKLAKGKYELKVGSTTYTLHSKPASIETNDGKKLKTNISYDNDIVTIVFAKDSTGNYTQLSGLLDGKKAKGEGVDENGKWTPWQLTFTEAAEAKKAKKEAKDIPKMELVYPFVGYGLKNAPKAETYLIKNATVWTNTDQGVLENHDVLVSAGKIKNIGKDLKAGSGVVSVDGTDMHLTPGIVDEHSHIAIDRGVNECSQASTAEVRIGDVINSEDVNIYRQLSGGVTAAQLLHGSCNPIGGQSAIIKLRWGQDPEGMKFENAPGFIKFALGENVKRSRLNRNNRFPNSRVGVEAVYTDKFTRAKEYMAKKRANDPSLRRDLDLETLGEILESERFISCHSYVQSEINMLMKVADKMGFTVNTFTHILEGYKVADKMAKHGAGGSTFSDWWAYKFEVYEAIPYNAALMHQNGVLTAINSDDREMARRLNQEAAKAVLFGGVSEEEALKMVTLNPAKLLHLDDRIGSIESGKDADIVLWNKHPLSIEARAEKTFIDGRLYFDRSQEDARQAAIQKERSRLIEKMLNEKMNGHSTQKVHPKEEKHYHCDTVEDELD